MTDEPHGEDLTPEQEKVGYGRPPRHSQFKPGQSGNAKGRPRAKRNMASLLGDVLAQKVTVTRNGKRKKIRSDAAILYRLLEKALAGDLTASRIVLSLRATHMPDREGEGNSTNLAEEDRAILASFGLLAKGKDGDDPL